MEYPTTKPFTPPQSTPNPVPPPEKKSGRLTRVLKAIFVHNLGYKLLAVLGAAVLWILAVGL